MIYALIKIKHCATENVTKGTVFPNISTPAESEKVSGSSSRRQIIFIQNPFFVCFLRTRTHLTCVRDDCGVEAEETKTLIMKITSMRVKPNLSRFRFHFQLVI